MTESEAIETMNILKNGLSDNFSDSDKCEEALNMAIKALEKQIPKKIILRWATMRCPVCENSSEIKKTKGYNFCPNCGQRWDWSNQK